MAEIDNPLVDPSYGVRITPEQVADLFPHLAPQPKTLNIPQFSVVDVKYKYSEEEIVKKALDYIKSTYNQHYVGENDVQTIDIWASLGSAPTTTRDTAIKYLMRYGRKDGYNEKDLLKAIHYTVLLYYFTQVKK